MASLDMTTDWQREAIDLKRRGLESKAIAEAVGKSAATVRKAVAKAREAGLLPIEGQTTVEDFTNLATGDNVSTLDEDVDPLTAFKAEAGEATGDMQERPGEETPEPFDTVVIAPPIRGTVQLALDFGPNAAMVTSATVTFKSEKLASGYFEMGDVVTGRFTARITAVGGAEKFDKDIEDWVAKPQAQVATITEIELDVGGAA